MIDLSNSRRFERSEIENYFKDEVGFLNENLEKHGYVNVYQVGKKILTSGYTSDSTKQRFFYCLVKTEHGIAMVEDGANVSVLGLYEDVVDVYAYNGRLLSHGMYSEDNFISPLPEAVRNAVKNYIAKLTK